MPEGLFEHPAGQAAIRLLLAVLLGGLIGLEREARSKAAGLRTNILISAGAALFTIASLQFVGHSVDVSRVAAQVVSGIGFIGGGVILRDREQGVVGLTTAATIFMVAAIGVACGAALWWPAIVGTAVVLATLIALSPVERRLRPWLQRHRDEVAPRHEEHGRAGDRDHDHSHAGDHE